MKKLLLLCLFPFLAQASGKISIEPNYLFNENKAEGKVGLSIWEHVGGPVAYNMWLGTGRDYANHQYNTWLTLKTGFEFQLPASLSIGVGAGVSCSWADQKCGPSVYSKLSYALWE